MSNNNDNHNDNQTSFPTHLYHEWTLEQDQRLWRLYSEQQPQEDWTALAVALGRGLGGVQARIDKLKDVNSAAYERLFVADSSDNGEADSDASAESHAKSNTKKQKNKQKRNSNNDDTDNESTSKANKKLVPATEVLRRLQWDPRLNEGADFQVQYYDRVDDTLVTVPVTAPNDHISGAATRLVDALPEHRIVAILFKERVVWDRRTRLDLVCGSGQEADMNLESVMAGYDAWKQRRDEERQRHEQERTQLVVQVQQVLGVERYAALERAFLGDNGADQKDVTIPSKLHVEGLVDQGLGLLREARKDPEPSLDPTVIPMNEFAALDLLSAWVAVAFPRNDDNNDERALVDELQSSPTLQRLLLEEIHTRMQRLLGKTVPTLQKKNRPLPELNEADLVETFVRGSGPGGQKINKTSDKVVLVHTPTNVRVECQETRSLPQNRKIARQRLRQKLDVYYHGSQSKFQQRTQTAASKKRKSKTRNRARQQQKQMQKKMDQKKLQRRQDDEDLMETLAAEGLVRSLPQHGLGQRQTPVENDNDNSDS